MTQTALQKFPLELADRCVKCGLCLPHCPTYQLTQDEAESPRGRIMLMQGLASGMLEQSAKLEKHLDQCLTCRACEVVCPADVPYGELIDKGREMLAPKRTLTPPLSSRALSAILSSNHLRRLLGLGLWIYQRSRLQWLLRHGPLLRGLRLQRVENLLPPITRPGRPAPASVSSPRGHVALFTGCVSECLEADVLQDASAVLSACGFRVSVPRKQGCCGALYQHEGSTARARSLANANLAAFDEDYDAIVGTASGCTAQLAEYSILLETESAGRFEKKVRDINAFLLENWPGELALRPLKARVAIHDPCTLRNTLRQAQAPYSLLERIPEIQLHPLTDNDTCCGAAGNYFITQPEMADRLGQRKRQAIEALSPDIVLTTNVGCALQLKAQIRQAGLDIPVMHPVSLLRQQLAG